MAKILLADDSATEVHVFKQMLQKHKHTVLVASNGEEALELARQDRPDLILMDIVMPQMDGFQATRHLKRNPDTAEIPIVIVSNKSQETDRIWGLRQGAAEYIVKPIEETRLIEIVERLTSAGNP